MKKTALSWAKVSSQKKSLGLKNEDIEYLTQGKIGVGALKYLARTPRPRLPLELAQCLAIALESELNAILDDSEIHANALSGESNQLISSLFQSHKEDIDPFADQIFKHHLSNLGRRRLQGQAAGLNDILSSDSFEEDDASKVLSMLNHIQAYYHPDSKGYSTWIGVPPNLMRHFFALIGRLPDHYSAQHSLLLFVYTFCLFVATFLDEMAVSAAQQSGQRRRNVVDQFFYIALPLERALVALLDFVLHKGGRFDGSEFLEFGLDQAFIDDSYLMIAACDRCREHLDDIYGASQYINRKTMNAIKERLTKTIRGVGVPLPEGTPADFLGSLFGQKYYEYRAMRGLSERSVSGLPSGPSVPSSVPSPAYQSPTGPQVAFYSMGFGFPSGFGKFPS